MTKPGKIREAVGVFDNADALDEAIAELETTAFSRETISVLGNQAAITEKFGASEIRPEDAEDNPEAPRQVPVHREERAIGTGVAIGGGAYLGAMSALLAAGAAISIPAIIAAAAIGGGGTGVLRKVLGGRFDKHIEKQIEKGGLILWVQTQNEDQEEAACDILEKYGAKHVHVHEIGAPVPPV